ncbi:MAG: hypothetical protein NC548_52725 [Lachnospiraceae bacterium]|nr:hypothetical protein [Lachnospiraceae bacterium]
MRKNPKYPPGHCFTVVKCEKCGESYEPFCELKHICRKQNSYPPQPDKEQNGEKENA